MNGFWFADEQQAIRDAVLRLCEGFDADYWRRTDESGDFPDAFVAAMAEAAGWAWRCRRSSAAPAWA